MFSRFVTTTWAQAHREDLLVLSRPMLKQKMDWESEVERLTQIKDMIQHGELTLEEARDIEE